MIDTTLFVLVLGAIVLALAIDVAALAGCAAVGADRRVHSRFVVPTV